MAKTDLPLVSIVTPVYNGEAFLDECIRSVLAQTYQNWEYIILDNCSSDRTLMIAEKYAATNNRIRIFSNTTLLPIMKNWNQALRHMSSDSRYCKVVHADDFLLPECLARMVDVAQACPDAGMVGAYCLWGNRVVSDGLPYGVTAFSGKEIGKMTLLDKIYCFWSPSALMIRSDIIRRRDCFFNEAHLHADIEVCYEILQEFDFAFVHQVLTYIRTHDDSVTSQVAAPYNKLLCPILICLPVMDPLSSTKRVTIGICP
jgi:glycosyltransferase involved in cell wall biosynthesis